MTMRERATLAKIKTLTRRSSSDQQRRPALAEEIKGAGALVDLRPAAERDLARLLGDEALARRLVRMQQRMPVASLPELIVFDWLQRNDIPFVFQGEFKGGRTRLGGTVPDFVVNVGGRGLVLRVQGDYWHTRPGNSEKDFGQKVAMMGRTINGLRVQNVVDLWESDLYQRGERTMQLAMAGIGARG